MIRAVVIGATGYAGAELVRLLSNHPHVEVVAVSSERAAGSRFSQECPWIISDLVLCSSEDALSTADFDVAFLAVEAGKAGILATRCADSNWRCIDLSADLRLKKAADYTEYYGRPWFDLAEQAIYGLPELVDIAAIGRAKIVSNPGCHPTAALLALMPMVEEGLLQGIPVIDSKTGASGAGRAPKSNDFTFSELDGGLAGYASVGHRHTPEIQQMVGGPVRFSPHLVPMARGLHATVYAMLSRPMSAIDLRALYESRYAGRPFVRIDEKQPSTKQVLGSNRCDIYISVDEKTQFAVICAAIDNLVKGAAGQAIQNMNIMFSLPEATGLPRNGVWP